jgi:omega-amidase
MSINLALLQMLVTSNKAQNLQKAAKLVSEAATNGANVVVLPECFNSPYGTKYFAPYAEELRGETASVCN